MNEMFEKVKNEVSSNVNTITAKTKSMLDISKLNSTIKELQDKKKQNLLELGSYVYNAELSGSGKDDGLAGYISDLMAIDNKIDECNRQILAIQNANCEPGSDASGIFCTCGAPMKESAKFCTKCGKKAEDRSSHILCSCGYKVSPGQKFCQQCGSAVDESEAAAAPRFCINCGNLMDSDSAFCINCGMKA